MKRLLKRNIHLKLINMHSVLGSELKSRGRLRFGRTLDLIEAMNELLIGYDSWQKRRGQRGKECRHVIPSPIA